MPCFDEAMIHRMLFCLVIPYCNIHFRFQSSQGSVAKLTTRDDQDSYLYVCHLFLNLTVKTALKSATFWRSYVQKHWWLDVRKCVKIEWWGVGVVICLKRGADCLHMVQLMSLHPKTPSSLAWFKSRLVLLFRLEMFASGLRSCKFSYFVPCENFTWAPCTTEQ